MFNLKIMQVDFRGFVSLRGHTPRFVRPRKVHHFSPNLNSAFSTLFELSNIQYIFLLKCNWYGGPLGNGARQTEVNTPVDLGC